MVDSARIGRANQNKIDQTILYNTLNSSISKESECTASMGGNTFDGTLNSGQEVSLKIPAVPTSIVYKKSNLINNTGLKFKSLNLKRESAGTPGVVPNTTIYQVSLNAQVETTTMNTGGSLYNEKKVGAFYVTVDNSDKIINCSSEGNSTAELCKKMNGTYKVATNDCEIEPKPEKVCQIVGGTFSAGKCALKTGGSGTASCKYKGKTVAKHGHFYQNTTGGCWQTTTKYQCFDGKLIKISSDTYKTCSCFTAETLVRMHDGSLLRIDKVKIGDKVIGENGYINNVIGIEKPYLHDRRLYSFNDDIDYFVTPEHPFKSLRGWVSIDPEMTKKEHPAADLVDVQSLKVGDEIYLFSGETVKVKRINSIEDSPNRTVYNLRLDGNNTYYANDYLVHNKP